MNSPSAKIHFPADSETARNQDPSRQASSLRQQARKVTWATEVRRLKAARHHLRPTRRASIDASLPTMCCGTNEAAALAAVPVFSRTWMSQRPVRIRAKTPLASIPVANTPEATGEAVMTNQCSSNLIRLVLVTVPWRKRVTLLLLCDTFTSRILRHSAALTLLSLLPTTVHPPIRLLLIHD